MKYLKSDIEKTYFNTIFTNYCGAEIELYFDTIRYFNVFKGQFCEIMKKTKQEALIKEQMQINPYMKYEERAVVELGFTLKNPVVTPKFYNEFIIELNDEKMTVEFELSSKKERQNLDKLIDDKWGVNFQVCLGENTEDDGTFKYDEKQNLVYVLVDKKVLQHKEYKVIK